MLSLLQKGELPLHLLSVLYVRYTTSLGFLWIVCICADQGKVSFPSLILSSWASQGDFFFLNELTIFVASYRNKKFLISLCLTQCEQCCDQSSVTKATSNSFTDLAGLCVCTNFIASIRPPILLEAGN